MARSVDIVSHGLAREDLCYDVAGLQCNQVVIGASYRAPDSMLDRDDEISQQLLRNKVDLQQTRTEGEEGAREIVGLVFEPDDAARTQKVTYELFRDCDKGSVDEYLEVYVLSRSAFEAIEKIGREKLGNYSYPKNMKTWCLTTP